MEKVVIVGFGNILLQDEGIGVHIAQQLQGYDLPKNIEVIDGGTASLDVLSSLNEMRKLIIVDAVKSKGKPATIYRFCPGDLAHTKDTESLSLHQIDVIEALRITARTSKLPDEIVIIGIEPKDVEWGTDLSPEVKDKIPDIIDLILEEAQMKPRLTEPGCRKADVRT